LNNELDIQDLNKIELSVIIVTFRSRSIIDACLDSIIRMNDIGDRLQVIVVDNSPPGDDTYDYISANYPWVMLLRNEKNGGFGQGNNLGARHAIGDVVLFLNPDTILIEPIFSFTLQRFRKHPRLAVCGYLLRNLNGNLAKSFGILPEKRFFFPAIIYLPLIKYLGYTPPNVYPWGAAMAIRRDLFLDMNGFDEGYFMCYEEPDFVHRLEKDLKVEILKRSITHLDGYSSEFQGIKKRTQIALQSEYHYFSKYSLNYRRYVLKARVSLRVKRFLKRILGVGLSAQDAMLLDFYRSYRQGTRRLRQE